MLLSKRLKIVLQSEPEEKQLSSFNEEKRFSRSKTEYSVKQGVLFDKLIYERQNICMRDKVPPSYVFSNSTGKSIAEKKPQTKTDLIEIDGLNKRRVEFYGDAILKIVKNCS